MRQGDDIEHDEPDILALHEIAGDLGLEIEESGGGVYHLVDKNNPYAGAKQFNNIYQLADELEAAELEAE
jgi:hypothetical protein